MEKARGKQKNWLSGGVPYDFFEAMGCEFLDGYDLYSAMFRLGDGVIQNRGEKEPAGSPKANPIAYFRKKGEDRGHFRIMFEDEFADLLEDLQKADFAILNGITYFGRRNVQAHASKMFALIFDLDGLDMERVRDFFHQCEHGVIPSPNYIVLSGHGFHLYYIFEEPLSLYPNIKLQLKELKYALTRKIWNRYTSSLPTPQFQGINQGFRVAGGRTKPGCSFQRSAVMRYRSKFYTLTELNQFVPEESRVDELQVFKETRYTLEEAKKKFPKWYERVVIGKETRPQKWDIAGKVHGDNPYALYDWWLKQIQLGASFGHRYFCIMILAIYAVKCDVPEERLKQDAYGLIPYMNSLHSEAFTEEDVESALECFDERYATFPLRDIEKLSAISIPRNKRNGRRQEQHLIVMRAVQNALNPNWRNQNGRPSNEQKVVEWRKNNPNGTQKECVAELGITEKTVRRWWKRENCWLVVHGWRASNPDGSKADCIRETGLSKPTVYKWWDYDPCIKEDQTETDELDEVISLEDAVNPEWHTELPAHFVVEGTPDMLERMMEYVAAGIRSVDILSAEEYEYLMKKENERLQEEAKGILFAESEVTEKMKAAAAKRGITLNIVSDEQYQAEMAKRWLASMLNAGDNQ